VASAHSQFRTCHRATHCLTSPTRSHENSSYLARSKAYDWLSHMAIALAIAKQKAIPCKYGDGYGSMPLNGFPIYMPVAIIWRFGSPIDVL